VYSENGGRISDECVLGTRKRFDVDIDVGFGIQKDGANIILPGLLCKNVSDGIVNEYTPVGGSSSCSNKTHNNARRLFLTEGRAFNI
jgi:hypothetical protein